MVRETFALKRTRLIQARLVLMMFGLRRRSVRLRSGQIGAILRGQNAYRVRRIIHDSLAIAIWVLFAVLVPGSRALRAAIALWLLSLTNLNTS